MQNESKGVYVQMPKPEPNNEAVKLLADLVFAVNDGDYYGEAIKSAEKYLEKTGIVFEKELH